MYQHHVSERDNIQGGLFQGFSPRHVQGGSRTPSVLPAAIVLFPSHPHNFSSCSAVLPAVSILCIFFIESDFSITLEGLKKNNKKTLNPLHMLVRAAFKKQRSWIWWGFTHHVMPSLAASGDGIHQSKISVFGFFLKEIKWASAPSIHSCVCCTYTWCFCVKKASLLRLRKCLGWIFLQTLAQTHTWTRMNWLGFGGWGVQRSRLPHDILWYELRCANSDECDVFCCVQKVFCGRDTEGFVTWPECVSLTGRFKRCYKPSSLEYAMFNSGLSCSCI